MTASCHSETFDQCRQVGVAWDTQMNRLDSMRLLMVIPSLARNLTSDFMRSFADAANERMPLAHEFSLSRWSGLTSRRSQRVEVNALHPRCRAKQFIGLFQASRAAACSGSLDDKWGERHTRFISSVPKYRGRGPTVCHPLWSRQQSCNRSFATLRMTNHFKRMFWMSPSNPCSSAVKK
jgi:hypothetical protein